MLSTISKVRVVIIFTTQVTYITCISWLHYLKILTIE